MVKISFNASKMDDCAATASAIAGMLRQASSAVSSAYGALDSRVASEVSNLSGASSSLDSIASEADKLSRFLNKSSGDASKLENSLLKSIQGTVSKKLSSDAVTAFKTSKKQNSVLGKVNSSVNAKKSYVNSLTPEEIKAMQIKNTVSKGIKGMFSGNKNNYDDITPEYAYMMMLSGDASQMEVASKVVSKGTNTEWVNQNLFPFLNDVSNGIKSNVSELVSIRSLDDLGRYIEHTGATILTTGASVGEALMKLGENVKDGIEGAFANSSAAQLASYGAIDYNEIDSALEGVAAEIKVDHTGDYWKEYWNSEAGKNLDANSYLKHDGAFNTAVKGTTTLAGYIALSLNPVGWAISASSVAGESYEHTLNEGGSLNEAIVNAAPMVLLDAGLNIVGGKTVSAMLGDSIKSGASAVKNGVKNAANSASDFLSNSSKIKVVKDTGKSVASFGKDTALAVVGLPSRFKLTPLTSGKDTVLKAYTDGMYHFTSESAADAIIASKTLKASKNPITSYGTTPKAYLFGGVPDVERMALNLDEIPLTASAVRIKPKAEQLSDFKYRSKYDKAIVHEGDLDLSAYEAEKVYFGLTSEDGKLAYKEISEAEFRNYHPNLSAEELKLVDGSLTSKVNAAIVGNKKAADLALDNIVGTYERIASGISDAVAKTKAALGKYSSAVADQRMYSRAPSLGIFDNLFSRGKKATKTGKATEKAPSLQALPKKEGYTTLTEADFENFSNELIKELENDPTITVKPTKEIIREDFWKGFSNMAENTYFEKSTLDYLGGLVRDENMVVAIHKTGNAPDYAIRNIMDEGLYVNGAALQGQVVDKFPGITRTATFVSDKKGLAESLQLHYVSPSDFSGKGSRNSIVVAYPKGLSEADVVQHVDGVWSIKPEYIVGYVPAGESGGIASVEGMIRNPKWYGSVNEKVTKASSEAIELFDAKNLPLSDRPEIRAAQEKMLRGEKLGAMESVRTGARDNAVTKLGDYELRSDYAYRAIHQDGLDDYLKTGLIKYPDDKIAYGGAIHWYLGGAAPAKSYGNIVLETPANIKYFQLADDYGGFMSGHPSVRHMYSFHDNPISMDDVTRVFFMDPKDRTKVVRVATPAELRSEMEAAASAAASFEAKTKRMEELLANEDFVYKYECDLQSYARIHEADESAYEAWKAEYRQLSHDLGRDDIKKAIEDNEKAFEEARVKFAEEEAARRKIQEEKEAAAAARRAKEFEAYSKEAKEKITSPGELGSLEDRLARLRELDNDKMFKNRYDYAKASDRDFVDSTFQAQRNEYERLVNEILDDCDLAEAFRIVDDWGIKHGAVNYTDTIIKAYEKNGWDAVSRSVTRNKGGMINPNEIFSKYSADELKAFREFDNARPNMDTRMYELVDRPIGRTNMGAGQGNKEIFNFYENSGNVLDKNFGVDQGVIESMCDYVLARDGKEIVYNYKGAKKIVNEALQKGEAIPKFKKIATAEYGELKNVLLDSGFSNSDASIILSSINDAGACSYAAAANNIFYKFRGNEDYFESIFGYSMYRTLADGTKALNSPRLILDLYTFVNDVSNGGKLLTGNRLNLDMISDTIDVFGRRILEADEQVYIATSKGVEDNIITRFLSSKDNSLTFDASLIVDNVGGNKININDMQGVVNQMSEALDNGKALYMSYFYNPERHPKVINMQAPSGANYSSTSTAVWGEGGGHAVAITGLQNDGVVISSWGEKYVIPYQDLMDGGSFNIYSTDILYESKGEVVNGG